MSPVGILVLVFFGKKKDCLFNLSKHLLSLTFFRFILSSSLLHPPNSFLSPDSQPSISLPTPNISFLRPLALNAFRLILIWIPCRVGRKTLKCDRWCCGGMDRMSDLYGKRPYLFAMFLFSVSSKQWYDTLIGWYFRLREMKR